MSLDLHKVYLLWDSKTRQIKAKRDGFSFETAGEPKHGLSHVTEIIYLPWVRWCRIRRSAGEQQDMSSDEMKAIDQWLSRVIEKFTNSGEV